MFVDSGAFIALHRATDDHHELAIAAWEMLEASSSHLHTTSYCVSEVGNFLARRIGPDRAADHVERWLGSRVLQIARPTLDDDMAAVELMRRYADQQIGFVDCVSFAIMHRLGIESAFTFDRHFATAGFTIWPGI